MIICGEEDENGSKNRENERLAGSGAKESHFGRLGCDESPARSEGRGGGGGAKRAKKACLSLSYSPAGRAQVTPSVQLE